MACIHKLNKAITFGCTGGQAGIEALYLVNRGDIKSLTRDYTGAVTDIVLDDYPGDANNLYVNGAFPPVYNNDLITPASGRAFGRLIYKQHTFVKGGPYSLAVCTTLPEGCSGIRLYETGSETNIIDVKNAGRRHISTTSFTFLTPVGDLLSSSTLYLDGAGIPAGDIDALHWAVLVEGPNAPVLPHSIPVDCYRNGVKLIETLRTADIGDRLEQTLSITLYNKADTDTLTKLVNGSFVAFVKMKELGAIYAVGPVNGLEISSADMDSNANGGFTAISLKTPDGCVGEQRVMCSKTAWDKVVTFSI